MKLVNPTNKTQVVPIIVSKAQGTGKTTFAEVICKGLFGKDNVLVTDQYDSSSRFNSDYADALIVCHEEKEYEDKRNSAAALKSRATATTIRKEHKGLDPIYQESYTDFIVTSNKDVPIKFEDAADQRRFMVMSADETFTRQQSSIADEVFTKLYGCNINDIKVGIPFVEDDELIAQFKHELYTNEQIKATEVRKFPHTAAYEKCFSLPRTTEAVEIESIVRSLAPFIQASLEARQCVTSVLSSEGEQITLASYLQTPTAFGYFLAMGNIPAYVALCRPLVFYDQQTGKPFNHATVERTIYDCDMWLIKEYGIRVLPITAPVPGGFYGINNRHRMSPTARFTLATHVVRKEAPSIEIVNDKVIIEERKGKRLRVNKYFKVDEQGEYETVNELKDGIVDLTNKSKNIQYMDTFLFEADETTKAIYMLEEARLKECAYIGGSMTAEKLFRERLSQQLSEAKRLFKERKACRIVYSGGKSYHVLVRIGDEPQTIDEYKWLHAHLCTVLSDKLDYDPVNNDPARLTRSPIELQRTFMYHDVEVTGIQRCIDTNWHNIYNYNWRPLYQQWLNRPLSDIEEQWHKRMLPTKPEYREAMYALLSGTFFTDSKWNGRRQQCFFPAYRLCRWLGYDHTALWSEQGILDGINKYYRSSEREYWKSRESSPLIAQIDKEIDQMNEEIINAE